jgi:hypothetical protein
VAGTVHAKLLAPATAILRADVVAAPAARARRGHPTGTKQHNNNIRHVSNNSTKMHISALISNAITNNVIINSAIITSAVHDMQRLNSRHSNRVPCA